MPRIARALADECCYHLINRGNGRQQVFHRDGDYQAFTDLLLQWRGDYGVKILAWCLMPNHFHLLVQPAEAAQLERWMQRLMTTHVRRYHKQHGTSGHLWQGRYKGFPVKNDDHLLTVAPYVAGNPVRARLAATAAEWPWSCLTLYPQPLTRTVDAKGRAQQGRPFFRCCARGAFYSDCRT